MRTLTVFIILFSGISSHAQTIDNDCFSRRIDCTSALSRPDASKCNNPFFGDWQYLQDSIYYEAFFQMILYIPIMNFLESHHRVKNRKDCPENQDNPSFAINQIFLPI
jgi:hypothetical protein